MIDKFYIDENCDIWFFTDLFWERRKDNSLYRNLKIKRLRYYIDKFECESFLEYIKGVIKYKRGEQNEIFINFSI